MTRPSTPLARRMEHLEVETCLELLARSRVGRVAFVVDGQPHVLPVNHCYHEGAIVFRTSYGTLLDSVNLANAVFEVDELDDEQHTGWSVLVRGRGEEVWEPGELERLRELPLRSWAPGDRDHYVRILPASITGRRIV